MSKRGPNPRPAQQLEKRTTRDRCLGKGAPRKCHGSDLGDLVLTCICFSRRALELSLALVNSSNVRAMTQELGLSESCPLISDPTVPLASYWQQKGEGMGAQEAEVESREGHRQD